MTRERLEALRAKKKKRERLQELRARRDGQNVNTSPQPQAQAPAQPQAQAPVQPQAPRPSGLGNIASSPRDLPPPTGREKEQEIAAYAGLGQGLTMGHSAELVAGAQATQDVLFDNYSLSAFGESYIANRNSNEEALDKLRDKDPLIFNTMNIAGHAASTPKSIVGSGVSAIMSGLGYAQPAKKSELMTIKEGYMASIKGIAYEAGAVGGLKMLGGVKPRVHDFYKDLKGGTLLDALGFKGKSKSDLMKKLRVKGDTLDDWADSIFKIKNKNGEKLVQSNNTYRETYDRAISIQEEIGQESGKIIDAVSQGEGKLKGGRLYNKIKKDHLNELLNSKHSKTRDAAEAFDRDLKRDFFDEAVDIKVGKGKDGKPIQEKTIKIVEKEMTLADLQSLKKDMADLYKSPSTGLPKDFSNARDSMAGKLNKKAVGSITGVMEEIVEKSKYMKENSKDFSKWKGLKQDYGNLKEVTSALGQTVDKLDSPGALNALRESINYRGLVLSGLLRSTGMPQKPAIALGLLANRIAVNPATPSTMAVQLKSLSDAFASKPNKYKKIASDIIASSAISSAALQENLASADAQITLSNSPVKRQTSDVLKKRDMLLTVLHREELLDEAAELREALDTENQSEAGKILNILSKNPKLKDYFEQGMGWDNKVTNKQELKAVEQQIKQKFGLRKQNELITKIRIDGSIPDMEKAEEKEENRVNELAKQKAGQRVKKY